MNYLSLRDPVIDEIPIDTKKTNPDTTIRIR